MTQVVYDNEKITKKACIFVNATGSSVDINDGWNVCYDADYGTATAEDGLRAMRVELPTAANRKNYAGVIATGGRAITVPNGKTQKVDVIVPSKRGQKINIFTDQNCTQDTTLLSLKASHIAGGDTQGPVIARALQTVDRSGTNGLVQAEFFGIGEDTQLGSANKFTASSRTAVQLPTAGIWNNFPIEDMRKNPFLGTLFETDFRRGEALPPNFVDATYAAAAGGKTMTEAIYPGTAAIGELILFTTTDNQAVELQWPCPVTISGGQPWAFEARIKTSLIGDNLGGWFLGLADATGPLAGDQITDAGALIDGGAIGFQRKEADGDKIDFIYDESGQAQNEHDADYVTPVADTYNTLGMYHNGTTIQGYLDGVATGTAISAADIAAADFPTGAILHPAIYFKSGNAADLSVTLDWIRAAQL